MTTATQRSRQRGPDARLDRWLAFTFGVIFVSILLYLATVVKNPNPLTIKVYATVLALAAAGVGAILPGFIEVRYKNFLRAGGAIGLGVLVYLNEPAIGTHLPQFVEPESSPDAVINAYLAAIDSGNPDRSWNLMSDSAREFVANNEATWVNLYNNNLVPLGHSETRTLVGQGKEISPPGFPPGIYRIFTYKSKFAADSGCRNEVVTVRANSSDAWEIFSYQISLATFPC